MKAKLVYHLPDEKFDHECAIKASDMWIVLKNLVQSINKEIDSLENLQETDYIKGRLNACNVLKDSLLNEITDNGLDNLIFNY
jgi:hypothetical protein